MRGYSAIASVMGRHAELGIVRKFAKLHMQNLLYHQEELTTLEKQLHDLARNDANSLTERKRYFDHDWEILSQAYTNGDERQWNKILEIRAKLKEYGRLLLEPQQTKSNLLEHL